MSYARPVTHVAHREALTSIYGVPMPVDDRGKAFAKLIIDGRQKRSWRQDDLVAASGVSRRLLTRWEGGEAERPDPEKVRAVCLALGIDPREAAVALGYLTEDEIAPAKPARPLDPEEQEILEILRDPTVPSAEKAPLIATLRFLRDRHHHEGRRTG
jgi:transcriptional regulator with XRE-family HTH domain